MIEFGLKHGHSSGWHKKFPRQKIDRVNPAHLGMREHLRLRNEYYDYSRNGYLSWKDLDKFFEANLGKNVDKVFSEYVNRAKRFNHDVNLKDTFYKALEPDRYMNDYTIDSQNRIIKLKKDITPRITGREASLYNEKNYPTLEEIKHYLVPNQLIYFGDFYVQNHHWDWIKTPVYICSKEWYDTVMQLGEGRQFVNMYNMTRIPISFPKINAKGVPARGFTSIDVPTGKKYHSKYLDFDWEISKSQHFPYTTYASEADYIFLVKNTDNWHRFYLGD